MKKKTILIITIVVAIIIGGGFIMNSSTLIKVRQAAFLKKHEEEIIAYIMDGLQNGIESKVKDIQFDYDSLEDEFMTGPGDFLPSKDSGKYDNTNIRFTYLYDNQLQSPGGGFSIRFNDRRFPSSGEIYYLVLGYPVNGTKENAWLQPTSENLIIGGKKNG